MVPALEQGSCSMRIASLTPAILLQADFLKKCDLPHPLATEDEIEEFRTQLSQVAYHTGKAKAPENSQPEPLPAQELSDMGYRKVPFENVRHFSYSCPSYYYYCLRSVSATMYLSTGPRSGGHKEGVPQRWVCLCA